MKLKAQIVTVNYQVPISQEQFKNLETHDFLDTVMPALVEAGAQGDIDYNPFFGFYIFFTSEPHKKNMVLKALSKFLDTNTAKE